MKRNLSVIFILALVSMAFAEKKVYYSDDGDSMGVIESASDGDKHLVMFQSVSNLYAGYGNYSLLYTFDSAASADVYYKKEIELIKNDQYDSFWNRFTALRDGEDFLNCKGNTFRQGNTIYTVKTVSYGEKKKSPAPAEPKNTDTTYETVRIKEISANRDKYNGKKVCIQNIKLLGEDPADRDGNIPAVVYANNSELITVKICPVAAAVFKLNKYKSLNYYGTFKKISDYDNYILVDKITVN